MISYLKAKLTSWKRINVVIFTDIPRPEKLYFSLYKEDKLIKKETVNHLTSVNSLYFFDIWMDEEYELGKNYRLLVGDLPCIGIEVNDAIYFHDFDERFYYEGDDLGNTYTKDKTMFALWAPLASDVKLRLISPEGKEQLLEMSREDKGSFKFSV